MASRDDRFRKAVAPLGKREERRAVAAAVSHFESRLAKRREPRFRVIGAELTVEKPRSPRGVPTRLVSVVIAHYDAREVLSIQVDAAGRVVSSQALDFQPVFHADEVAEARALVEQDAPLRRAASRKSAFVHVFGPHQDRRRARLIGLQYLRTLRGDRVESVARAVVDLDRAQVVSVERYE